MLKGLLAAERSEVGDPQEEDLERRAQEDVSLKLPSISLSKVAKIAKKGGEKIAQLKAQGSQPNTITVQRYLPKDIKGVPVLIPELGSDDAGMSYLVDST